jgi:hypothetical protein
MNKRPKLEAMIESARRVTQGVPSWMLESRSYKPAQDQTAQDKVEDKKVS